MIIFLLVVVTVTIGSFLMTPVYEASSKILVKFGRENVFTHTTPSSSGRQPIFLDSSREERINSEIEIFKGRNLIQQTISEIGIENIYPNINKKPLIPRFGAKKLTPIAQATRIFEKNLRIGAVRKTDVIEVGFQHSDPQIASQSVNSLIEAFLAHHLSVHKQSQQYRFFNEQVVLLKQKLRDSEQQLENLRKQNNISSLEEQKTLLLKQISDLELELAKTRGEISENKGKMAALRGNPTESLPDFKMGEETELNPYAISAIRNRLADLRLKEEELLGKYTEGSVMVTNVRREIKKAQDLLRKEEKIYHDKAVTSITHTLNALKSKEVSQNQHLSDYRQELRRINSVELHLMELERQVELNEENYQLYIKNMEEARISDAMDTQKIANISVIEPAQPPNRPIKPKKLLNFILSIFLGALLAMGVAFTSEYLNHSFNNSGDVKRHLGLKVMASIPDIKSP